MERLKKIFFCLIILLASFELALNAQVSSVSATGHIYAEIIPVFTATEMSQMDFGRFSPGPEGGEILLTPESTISFIGNIHSGVGNPNAASFYISGFDGASFTITLPQNPVVLTHASGSRTMVISDWISDPGPGMGAGVLSKGCRVVKVGAKLKVGSLEDNPVGIYAGTYTITFDFN